VRYTVALGGAVAEDPEALQVNGLVLVVAAHELDGLAAGPGDGETAEGDELRLLKTDGSTTSLFKVAAIKRRTLTALERERRRRQSGKRL